MQTSNGEDLVQLVGEVEQGKLTASASQPLAQLDERPESGTGDRRDIGEVEEQVSPLQSIHAGLQLAAQDVLPVPHFAIGERDDPQHVPLFQLGPKDVERHEAGFVPVDG